MALKSATQTISIDAPAEDAFYIAATQSASRPRCSLKCNDTFIVLDTHGDMGAASGGTDGLFSHDTRFLSQLQLLINGAQPLLLGSNLRDDNAALVVDLTNPDVFADQRIVLEKDTLHILRTVFLWRDTVYQRFGLRNYGDRPIDVQMAILFANDFADLFEVRGTRRERRGASTVQLRGSDQALLNYHGLDDKLRRTTLTFDPPADRLATNGALYKFKLAPGASRPIFLAAGCNTVESRPVPFLRALIKARRETRESTLGRTSVQTSNELFNEMLCRAAADLQILMTDTPQGRYPYAGIPWFSTTFGRDGLITALQMLWWNPDVARGVLRRLAHYQARTTDPLADAEPGKILHEMRGGEMAALREVPFGLYYGSVDSTPLFILLAGLYLERTGDVETIAELWPAICAALGWIDGPGDPDGDGFTEYLRATEQGLVNQGWKDSHDAIFHADGRLAEGAIALAEVQGYVYAAKRMAACCVRRLGREAEADKLDAQAKKLAEQFETAFWCPEIETYALALDGAKRPCVVHTSNAGQVLLAASLIPSALPWSPKACYGPTSSPAGASARWRAANRATIRCRIITARSGRTTTR
jgi:glycogen debranching enzyme